MRREAVATILIILLLPLLVAGSTAAPQPATNISTASNGVTAPPAATPAPAIAPSYQELKALEAKRQELTAKETALAAKEEELRQLLATIDQRSRQAEEAEKRLNVIVGKQKIEEAKQKAERQQKVIRVYKGLKPDEAARLLNKLDPDTAIAMINEMDKKSIIRLIPNLTEPRVIRWTLENLGKEKQASQPPRQVAQEGDTAMPPADAGQPQ
jgi:flagellar motility protein MotE (MotC chaperone)